MKIFFTALLSFLTLIGGHFVNRRWDRAILFISLFLIFLISCFIGYSFNVSVDPETVLTTYLHMYNTIIVGVVVFLVISTVVAVRDFNKTSPVSQVAFTLSGKIGSTLLSLCSVGLLLFILSSYFSYKSMMDMYAPSSSAELTPSTRSTYKSKWFNESVKFGTGRYIQSPKKIAEGKGYFTGKIIYQGKPASGVRLKLEFNDAYASEELTTDDSGQFVVRMPVGEWYLTRVEADKWENKPEGEFLLVSGYEPKLSAGSYTTYPVGVDGGLFVNITTEKPDEANISLTISPKITFENKHQNRRPAALSIKEESIEWPSYKGATQYQVKIARINKEGKSTSYYPIASHTVMNSNVFALKELKSSSMGTGDEKQIYSVSVFAFKDDGSYLSQSKNYRGYQFQFKEDVKLQDDKGGFYNIDSITLRNKYRKRFDAIEFLIDEKFYPAANKLLQGDMAGSTPGKKEAMWGYYYASQKQCDKAKEYFNKANEIGGSACVINKHEQLCM